MRRSHREDQAEEAPRREAAHGDFVQMPFAASAAWYMIRPCSEAVEDHRNPRKKKILQVKLFTPNESKTSEKVKFFTYLILLQKITSLSVQQVASCFKRCSIDVHLSPRFSPGAHGYNWGTVASTFRADRHSI
jgi:hypothetical protein